MSEPHPHPPGPRPSAPSERLDRRVEQACSAAGTLIEYWGFKSIIGRIWTLLALKNKPMAQTEIADTLGVSKSLVSSAVTELLGHGVVRAVGEGRNAPYEAVMDVWPAITDILRTREWMLLESTRLALDAAVEEARIGGRADYDPVRMELIKAMIESIQKLLKLLISIRMPDSTDGVREWIDTATALIENLRTES